MEQQSSIRQSTKILLGVAAVSLYLAASFAWKVFGSQVHELQVSFLDIGQGDAIYIKAPNGRDMLIDGGRTAAVLQKKLVQAMAPGDDSIDVVIATHPDADHIGGLSRVIENYAVGEFIEPGVSSTTKTYTGLIDDVQLKSVPHLFARTGTRIVLDGENNVVFTILEPQTVTPGEDTNDASVVGILSYGDKRFMFTGDAPIVSENDMIEQEKKSLESVSDFYGLKNLHVDVLKLGHHGSRTSSSEAFLEEVHPNTAIISAGCDNSYGHPHKEVVDRIAMLKILSFSTCTSGTITFYSDGVTLKRVLEK